MSYPWVASVKDQYTFYTGPPYTVAIAACHSPARREARDPLSQSRIPDGGFLSGELGNLPRSDLPVRRLGAALTKYRQLLPRGRLVRSTWRTAVVVGVVVQRRTTVSGLQTPGKDTGESGYDVREKDHVQK
ncbi:unnamed protein product [Arctogadus glacialis]